MIEIKNVSKTYNGEKKAINNINFDIKDGEIFAFIGHNGAGKTTMIKSLVVKLIILLEKKLKRCFLTLTALHKMASIKKVSITI